MNKSRYHVIVVVDIESFGRRTDTIQKWLRLQLYRIMGEAFAGAGIAVDDFPEPHDRGDGAFWLLPGSVAKQDLAGPFIDRLHGGLEEYAAVANAAAAMRLRVSLHAGEVAQDDRGWVGADLNTACRLVDAQPLRDVLAAADRAHLALVVSGQWYSAVVRHGVGGIAQSSYSPVTIGIKELNDTVWIRVPGFDSPPGMSAASDARHEDVTASTGTKNGPRAEAPPSPGGPAGYQPEQDAESGTTGYAPPGDPGRPAALGGGGRVVHDHRRSFENATVTAEQVIGGDQINGPEEAR